MNASEFSITSGRDSTPSHRGLFNATIWFIVARVRFHRALLFVVLVGCCAAQSPKSITYLRLGQQIVEQRSQLPATSDDWSAALRQQYIKAGIPSYQIVDQTVPGSSQRMVICTIAGRMTLMTSLDCSRC